MGLSNQLNKAAAPQCRYYPLMINSEKYPNI